MSADQSPPAAAPAQHHLFVYGSLTDPRRVDDVLGHAHLGERLAARLRGYERLSPASYPYAFIVPRDDRSVEGVLLMDLSPCDLRVLDRYEDVDAGMYRRSLVEVEVDAWTCGPRPRVVQAFTYVAGPRLSE